MSKKKNVLDLQLTPVWFEIDARVLQDALEQLSPLLPKRVPQFPVLNCVLVRTTADAVTLVVTNLEEALTLTVPARVESPEQALALPYKTFVDWVKTQSDLLAVTLNPTAFTAEVKAGRSKATFKGTPANEFPAEMPAPRGVTAKMDAPTFAKSVERVAFAAAPVGQSGRPNLEGVFVTITRTQWSDLDAPPALCAAHDGRSIVTLDAADGFRLTREQVLLSEVSFPEDAKPGKVIASGIVPTAIITLAAKLAKGSETLTLVLDDTRALFRVGNADLRATLIIGQYPDLTRLIPTDYPAHATLPAGDLQSAVTTTHAISNECIVLVFADNQLTVSVTEAETGDVVGQIPLDAFTVPADTLPLNVRLDPAYLREALCAVASVPVPAGTKRAVEFVMRPVASDAAPASIMLRAEGAPTWTHVIMPLVAK